MKYSASSLAPFFLVRGLPLQLLKCPQLDQNNSLCKAIRRKPCIFRSSPCYNSPVSAHVSCRVRCARQVPKEELCILSRAGRRALLVHSTKQGLHPSQGHTVLSKPEMSLPIKNMARDGRCQLSQLLYECGLRDVTTPGMQTRGRCHALLATHLPIAMLAGHKSVCAKQQRCSGPHSRRFLDLQPPRSVLACDVLR